jgi:mannose/cellobiose epimerase-like protein (N-acyl-D-glucosamine 2-epimerase family)
MLKEVIKAYNAALWPSRFDVSVLLKVISDYEAILLSTMEVIADRYERKSEYPWIDTKIDLVTGEDFKKTDVVKGPDTIYGWIQGRGLEALTSHIIWLESNFQGNVDVSELIVKLKNIIGRLLIQLEIVRRKNAGHLYFFMSAQGQPFMLNADGTKRPVNLTSQSAYNFSDLFAAKGMYIASQYLQNSEMIVKSKEYCHYVNDAIWENKFLSDQTQIGPRNTANAASGRHTHAPFMIEIGTAALLAQYEKDRESIEFGLKLIRHILQYHVNLNNRWPNLADYDFVEFLDDDNQPFIESGRIASDPGHSLEFVGLTLKFTAIAKQIKTAGKQQLDEIEQIEKIMPHILKANFANGFASSQGGICKLFDLLSRTPLNTDMPWWSLPETLRASLECWSIAKTDSVRQMSIDIAGKCHDAFIKHYVRPELNLMAVQTRSRDGSVADVVPATPDADPGYHTGLCLIDSLEIIKSKIDKLQKL